MTGHYTNISRWILPFESIWGIANKICVFNHMSLMNLKKAITLRCNTTQHTDALFHGLSKYNYLNSEFYNHEVISEITSIPLIEMPKHDINTIVNKVDQKWLTSMSNLRYCRHCIKEGYHSIFHQIYLFDFCPIHNEILIDSCILCELPIKYELDGLQKINFGCNACQSAFWVPHYQKDGVYTEKKLDIRTSVIAEFEEIFEWLIKVRQVKAIKSNIDIERSVILRRQDAPFLTCNDMLGAWGLIPEFGSMPNAVPHSPIPMQLHSVIFGAGITERFHTLCKLSNCKVACQPETTADEVRLVWGAVNCIVDGSKELSPIYKSIKRHLFRKFSKIYKIRCNISGLPANTYRLSSVCRKCKWAKAYFYWRQYWTSRLSDSSYFWDDLFDRFKDLEHPLAVKWATLWVFALECLYSFEQAAYLTETNYSGEIDIHPELALTWVIVNPSSSKHPIIRYWIKSIESLPTFECMHSQ
jgi:hypothetical protein